MNKISLSEVWLAGDTNNVRGENPHTGSTTATTSGELHLNLDISPHPFHTAGKFKANIKAWWKEKTRYQLFDGSQVLNRSIVQHLGSAKAGERTQSQREHSMAQKSCPPAKLMPCWEVLHSKLKVGGTVSTDPKSVEIRGTPHASHKELVPFCLSPCPTIRASLDVPLLEPLSPLCDSCYSSFC